MGDVEAVTRAEFVRRMGIASAGLAIGPGLLAACGGGGGGESTVNLADIGVTTPVPGRRSRPTPISR